MQKKREAVKTGLPFWNGESGSYLQTPGASGTSVMTPDLVAFGLDVDGLSKVGEEGVLHLHEFGTAHAAGGAELREVELVALECPAADEKIAACVAGDLAVGAELDGRRDFTFLGGTVGPH